MRNYKLVDIRYKMPKLKRGLNLTKAIQSSSKFYQVIYTLVPNCLQNFISLTHVVSSIFCLQENCDVQTNGQMDKPKALSPLNFFEVGGIKRDPNGLESLTQELRCVDTKHISQQPHK